MVLGYTFEPAHVAIFFTLILLEGILAFDNAAVLAAIVRKLPEDQRRRALTYGIVGAYVFRIAAILGAVYLIRYPVIRLIGGAYLVYLAVKHLFFQSHEPHMEESLLTKMGFSGFWATVVSIELADIAFAIDQVIVAVAFTDEIVLIIAASLIAILFLRISAAYLSRLMDWFPQLEELAYVAVGFVGAKLVVVDLAHRAGFEAFEIPKEVSVVVTLTLLLVPVLGKLAWDRWRAPAA